MSLKNSIAFLILLIYQSYCIGQTNTFTLTNHTFTKLYYENPRDSFIILTSHHHDCTPVYLYRNNDTIYSYRFRVYTAQDSDKQKLISLKRLRYSIDNELLNSDLSLKNSVPGIYLDDTIFNKYYNNHTALKIIQIDTFILNKKGIIKIDRGQKTPFIDTTCSIGATFTPYDNLSKIYNSQCGAVYIFNYFDAMRPNSNYSYYYLKDFWIIGHKGNWENYWLDRVNSVKFPCNK